MVRCFQEMPTMAQAMLKRDAMRSGFISGRDLLAAKRDMKMSETSEEYENLDADSTEIAEDDDEYESLTKRTV
jgi:hypothetical protein